MNLRIRKMTIENFKGIKSLEVEVNGKNAVVYGDNATAKLASLTPSCGCYSARIAQTVLILV